MNIEEQLSAYGDVECNEPLAKHTTFRIGGRCAYFIYPKNEVCFIRIVDICKAQQLPYRVFGKGSNLLCSDDFYEGVIICLDRYMNEIYFEKEGACVAQAGCSIILLAHEAMKRSFSGLEFASGIPGTLGGALYMNAGAYRSSISDVLKQVFVYKDGKCEWLNVDELAYGYRQSRFQQERDWIILAGRLQLEKGDQSEIKALMDSRRQRRMDTQPLDKPSAGSTFRNPENASAWELIDKIGYRGKNIGGAAVSAKHPNFIINEQQASAEEVFALITEIQTEVKKQFGIELHTEVERFNWKT